jgi:chromosome segregation ATPase
MGDPVELGSNTGIVASITAGVTLAAGWLTSLALKRMGITAATASEVNNQAQKDMLDWQRDQLKDEVTRREKAETQVQELHQKLNDFTIQMGRLETQNQKLQDQVQLLTLTVQQLKAGLARADQNAS